VWGIPCSEIMGPPAHQGLVGLLAGAQPEVTPVLLESMELSTRTPIRTA
jgi:hypothetical protein